MHPHRSSSASARRTGPIVRRSRDAVERLLPRRSMFCYTNNIPQKDGGTHLSGFRAALTRTINDYIEKEMSPRRRRSRPRATTSREGLTAILSRQAARSEVLVADQGQAGLVRGEGRGRVRGREKLGEFLLEQPDGSQGHRRQDHRRRARARSGPQGPRNDAPQGRARHRGPARQARRLPGKGSRRCRRSSSSRATRPAARPSRAATGAPRPSCRSRARS